MRECIPCIFTNNYSTSAPIQVSNDFPIVCLISPYPTITPICPSHSSIIHWPPHVCTVVLIINLIPHLLVVPLLRIHSRTHWGDRKHHSRHRWWEPHRSHHEWI